MKSKKIVNMTLVMICILSGFSTIFGITAVAYEIKGPATVSEGKSFTVTTDVPSKFTFYDVDGNDYTSIKSTSASFIAGYVDQDTPTSVHAVYGDSNEMTLVHSIKILNDAIIKISEVSKTSILEGETFKITVIDGRDNTPVAGATVNIGSLASKNTDLNGVASFTLTVDKTDTYVVKATKAKWSSYEYPTKITIRNKELIIQTPKEGKSISERQSIQVVVTDQDNRPISCNLNFDGILSSTNDWGIGYVKAPRISGNGDSNYFEQKTLKAYKLIGGYDSDSILINVCEADTDGILITVTVYYGKIESKVEGATVTCTDQIQKTIPSTGVVTYTVYPPPEGKYYTIKASKGNDYKLDIRKISKTSGPQDVFLNLQSIIDSVNTVDTIDSAVLNQVTKAFV